MTVSLSNLNLCDSDDANEDTNPDPDNTEPTKNLD